VSGKASAKRLVAVTLDGHSISRGSPDVEHERAVALYDLLQENVFAPAGHSGGPYHLTIGIAEKRLVFRISNCDGESVATHALSLTPFRKIVKDYFLVCESYYQAIKTASPSRIEAIDMGRRALHEEGSKLLQERLKGKIAMDSETARRLFTLICVLHWRR
jgi:uncharacterized protein (UPF0262 family)